MKDLLKFQFTIGKPTELFYNQEKIVSLLKGSDTKVLAEDEIRPLIDIAYLICSLPKEIPYEAIEENLGIRFYGGFNIIDKKVDVRSASEIGYSHKIEDPSYIFEQTEEEFVLNLNREPQIRLYKEVQDSDLEKVLEKSMQSLCSQKYIPKEMIWIMHGIYDGEILYSEDRIAKVQPINENLYEDPKVRGAIQEVCDRMGVHVCAAGQTNDGKLYFRNFLQDPRK